MTAILSVESLCKRYQGKREHLAVDHISFKLNQGEILGFLGPNGSGKTTTIQMLLGTLSKTSGKIIYFGKDFETNRSETLNQISYASAYTSLPWALTLEENLNVFGYLYGFDRSESEKLYTPLLKRFGMDHLKKYSISSLSAGQVTKLMLVKAFFIEPKIVLLDEPTASLDPEMANEICDFILEERKRRGLSILFTSHKMEECATLCDRIIFLKNGKILADDTPKNLAKSIRGYRIKLLIVDGMKRLINLLESRKISFKLDNRNIEVNLEEENIPNLLHELSSKSIQYSSIKIEEPSLEDYFLQMSKR